MIASAKYYFKEVVKHQMILRWDLTSWQVMNICHKRRMRITNLRISPNVGNSSTQGFLSWIKKIDWVAPHALVLVRISILWDQGGCWEYDWEAKQHVSLQNPKVHDSLLQTCSRAMKHEPKRFKQCVFLSGWNGLFHPEKTMFFLLGFELQIMGTLEYRH